MTPPPRLPASHDIADHTSELRVRLSAGSLAELLAEAGRALAEIQLRGARADAGGDWRPVEVTAPDPVSLMADWLNELIFLAETERWVATEFAVDIGAECTLRGRARGITLPQVPGLVKAATLHRLRVEPAAGGWTSEVILDV
ncbi:MAG TPA: archease [Gemmatimonadales bacterium]|nr:archease [Gemmatimonadales bacterium]